MPTFQKLLGDSAIRTALKQAWLDSRPGSSGCHEEGGFICQNPVGGWKISRWPAGVRSSIVVPSHLGGQVERLTIVATFHTHPNTGPDYLQEPSQTDKQAVRDDPHLKGDSYYGELVISREKVYLIHQDGSVILCGDTDILLGT